MQHDLNWKLRLGFLVHDVSRLRRNAIDRELKPLGITRSQWWVLAFLSRQDGMSQVALADQLDVGKVAVGGLIDRLEASGFVVRQPDPVDRRVKRLFLTAKGTSLMKKFRQSVSDTEETVLAGIVPEDLEASVRALRGMKKNLLLVLGKQYERSADDI